MTGGLEDWTINLSWKNRTVKIAGGLEDRFWLENMFFEMARGLEDWRIKLRFKNMTLQMAGGLEDWRINISWKNCSF